MIHSILLLASTGFILSDGGVALPSPTVCEPLDALVSRTLASGARELHLTDGVYRVERPIALGPAASGFRLIGTGRTVVTGARVWRGLSFSPCGDGTWRTAAKLPFAPDGLIVGGRPMRMARFPNVVPGKPVYGVWDLAESRTPDPARDPLAPARIARWKNPRGAILHVMHQSLWGDVQYRVTGRSGNGSLGRKGGGQMNRFTTDHPVFRYVENVREELDAPGEWFYDSREGELLVWPHPGQDLARDVVEYTCLPSLVTVRGATNVLFSGLVFTGTRRTMMETVERVLLSDWTLCRQAAVAFQDAVDCTIADCDFVDLGGNAVLFAGFNRGHAVVRSLFRDIGASGVVFSGETSSVRSPRLDYDLASVADVLSADRTPGPAGEAYPRQCSVEDCLFMRTGREEKQTAPVTIFVASSVTVRDCTIHTVPRAGINIGTGAFGGHLVEGCDVFDTVLETGDHGAFNSWGRDRFWTADLADIDAAVAEDPSLRFLDAQRTTVLRGNRWRCDHGWDVDLDDGSSNYLIEDNVMLAGGLKLREGFGRIARGNYLLNNGLHAHCWLREGHDVFTNNVVFAPVSPAGRALYWGDALVPNVMAAPDAVPPMPRRRFGVRTPRLRALAREPTVPAVSFPPPRAEAKPFVWRGMTLRAFDGPVEFSAYGVTPATRGFVVVRGAHPPFANGDLLLGETVPAASATSFEVEVVRNQCVIRLAL